MIYLASTSPRRKALLRKAGIQFRVVQPDYDEFMTRKTPPSQVVQIHAVKKAESCRRKIKNGILLAADTLVYLKGEAIGKPRNMREARLILGKLQGRWHWVYTGVALLKLVSGRTLKKLVFFEKTKVRLKKLSPRQIKNYFLRVHPLDKAGAYAIQSAHGGIIQAVKGPLSNAVGLPVEKVREKLRAIDS